MQPPETTQHPKCKAFILALRLLGALRWLKTTARLWTFPLHVRTWSRDAPLSMTAGKSADNVAANGDSAICDWCV